MKAELFCNRLLAEDFSLCRFHKLSARGNLDGARPRINRYGPVSSEVCCERMASIWSIAEFSTFSD